jgi:hypothetical protein
MPTERFQSVDIEFRGNRDFAGALLTPEASG